MGATHALRGDAPILADHITPTAGGGADHAFEVIGLDRLVVRTTKLDGWTEHWRASAGRWDCAP